MDFIFIPLVVGIITLGIYKLFELFVRRKERLIIVEKIGDKIDPSFLNDSLPLATPIQPKLSFGSIRAACLLIGIGLGLIVGYGIASDSFANVGQDGFSYETRQMVSVIFGASVLLFSGLGLLVAFFVEIKLGKRAN